MKITAHYDVNNHVVITVAAGKVTSNNNKLAVSKALELSKEHACYNLFFDITQCEEGQSIFDAFDFGQNLLQIGLELKHRIAMVYNPAIYSTERAQFVENVISNRPNPPFRFFTDRKDALGWLELNK